MKKLNKFLKNIHNTEVVGKCIVNVARNIISNVREFEGDYYTLNENSEWVQCEKIGNQFIIV